MTPDQTAICIIVGICCMSATISHIASQWALRARYKAGLGDPPDKKQEDVP